MYAPKPAMVWDPSLSELVLNRVVELVLNGMACHNGFRETQMQKVVNDVLDFTGVKVTTLQLYNHLRKWRMKWNNICTLREHNFITWSSVGSFFMIEDDEQLRQHLAVRNAWHYFRTPHVDLH